MLIPKFDNITGARAKPCDKFKRFRAWKKQIEREIMIQCFICKQWYDSMYGHFCSGQSLPTQVYPQYNYAFIDNTILERIAIALEKLAIEKIKSDGKV